MDKFDMGIKYEVALEVLGQRLQPMIAAIQEEKGKNKPSLNFIKYCETRIDALEDLQDSLTPDDKETILKILNTEVDFKVI